MQATNVDYGEEMSIKILTIATQRFNLDQVEFQLILDNIISEYKVDKECTALVVSDVLEKLEIYIANKKLDGISLSTLQNYYREISKFSKYIVMPLNAMTTVNLRTYLATYHEKVQPSTYNSKVSILKTFFTWLHSEGYIDTNPSAKIKWTKVKGRVRRPIEKDDLEEMISKAKNPREEALINFMLFLRSQ